MLADKLKRLRCDRGPSMTKPNLMLGAMVYLSARSPVPTPQTSPQSGVMGSNQLERIATFAQAFKVPMDRQTWYELYELANGHEVP